MEPYEEYFGTILNEIEFFGKILKRKIQSIYFGGGTPSILRPKIIQKILKQIHRYFKVLKNAEITIEVNPESMTIGKASEYKAFGINRISAGIQSFNGKFLKKLGRAGTVEDNIKLFKILECAGFKNISADLMFGLPGQRHYDWIDDLKKLIQYEPRHISAYMLTPPEGMRRVNLPSEERCRKMLLNCIEFLETNGWRQYEISNYARKGYECRHNLNYWNYGEYLGIGAGAHSFLKGKIKGYFIGVRWWNTSVPSKFSSGTTERGPAGYEFITPEMALEEFIMLGLRKRAGIKFSELKGVVSFDAGKLIMRINPLIKDGSLLHENNCIKLTVNGIAVSNSVIIEVWRALEESVRYHNATLQLPSSLLHYHTWA